MRLNRSDIRKLIIETLIKEGASGTPDNDSNIYRVYSDKSGYKFKVGSDLSLVLVGKDDETYDKIKSFDEEQKIKVAKALIKDLTNRNKKVSNTSALYRIANPSDSGSASKDQITYEDYSDESGYNFKVGSDLSLVLVGRGNEKYDNKKIKSFSGTQKIEVAKALIKDLTNQDKKVSNTSFLHQIANPTSNSSNPTSENNAKVYLINFPSKKPFTQRFKDQMTDTLGQEKAGKMKKYLDDIFPQGHGAVYLENSKGKGYYYDFGCYSDRCKKEIETNFLDDILKSLAPQAFGAPGEVRKYLVSGGRGKVSAQKVAKSMNSGAEPLLFPCGNTTDAFIELAVKKADEMYAQECIHYSLIPRLTIGQSYNCGTFAITIATLAKEGSVNDSYVQYANNSEPGIALEKAAEALNKS